MIKRFKGFEVSKRGFHTFATVRKGAKLFYTIADKGVEVEAGHTLMGQATYPIVLAKNSKV